MESLSTVIIAYNEEDKIERCILSAQEVSEEIIIIDSFSTDRTVEIAQSLGATIYAHKFEGFIEQRRIAIGHATHNLVLALDADEYLSPQLALEILHAKENKFSDAYLLNRLSSIEGRWIRNGSWHPDYIIRLFYKDKVTNGGEAPHDKIIPNKYAKRRKLKGVLFHDAHDSIEDRIASIDKHSSVAATSKYQKGIKSSLLKAYIKTGWKFFSEYILRLGILDGYYGWIAATTTARYIFLRETKIINLWRR